MLENYLKEHGISRVEFGRDGGVTGQAVSRWIAEVAIPRPETQLLISELTEDEIPLKYWAGIARDRAV